MSGPLFIGGNTNLDTNSSSNDFEIFAGDADAAEASETETEPEYYKQTARKGAHGLTAIEGRVQDLVWKCRTCGEARATLEAFQGVACDG